MGRASIDHARVPLDTIDRGRLALRPWRWVATGALAIVASIAGPRPGWGQPAPPIVLPDVGTLHLARPPALVIGNSLTFDLGGKPLAVAIDHAPRGSCAYEGALVMIKVGKPADRAFAEGYWPTVTVGADTTYGCLDLREGYLTVLVSPAAGVADVPDVLAEVRRAAYVKHGAPITNESDPMILPATQQRVSARHGVGRWKVVDGERVKLPGADLLVSIEKMAGDGSWFGVAVREGPCSPGATAMPAGMAAGLFPAALGPAWVEAGEYKLRWTGWTCLRADGVEASIHVLAPVAHDEPPTARDLKVLRPLIDAIARSYGIERPAPPTWSRRRQRTASALVGGYLGVLAFTPPEGDRRFGLLLGLDARVKPRGGIAVAFDLEAGFGAGELIGEARVGGGLALGHLEAIGGLSLGSIGPAAALDVYGQLGATLPLGRSRLWVGGLHALGVGGPDHSRLDVRLVMPTRDDAGVFLGARMMWFGDDADTMMDTGTALMITFGGGAASDD